MKIFIVLTLILCVYCKIKPVSIETSNKILNKAIKRLIYANDILVNKDSELSEFIQNLDKKVNYTNFETLMVKILVLSKRLLEDKNIPKTAHDQFEMAIDTFSPFKIN